jgi:hypothetical protein
MMMLSAVVLLVGFLALTGMVARVNQLGTQTGIESRQAILDEAGPLRRSIDDSLVRLSNRTVANCCHWDADDVLRSGSTLFSASDVGLAVSGPGIPSGARITAVTSPTSATLSSPMAAAQPSSSPVSVSLWRPGFALSASTTPTAESAVIAFLDHLQVLEAKHGFWMDWRLECVGADPARGLVIASLSDATLWLEIRSSVSFPRATCDPLTG